MKKIIVIVLVALTIPLVARSSNYTSVFSQWIQDSLIDATPIGQTTPAAANFTLSQAQTSGVLGGGDGTHPGLWFTSRAPAGFNPYGTGIWLDANSTIRANEEFTTTGIDSTPIGQIVQAPGGFSSLSVGASGNALMITPSSTSAPFRRGITLGPDPGGDFTFWVNSLQSGPEFFFRDGNTGATWASIASTGINGNLNGNAATASALAATPSQCASGTFGTGITTNGSANCASITAAEVNSVGNINNNTNGNAATASSLATTPSNCGAGLSSYGIAANGNALCRSSYDVYWTFTGCNAGAPYNAAATCGVLGAALPVTAPDTNYSVSCNAAFSMPSGQASISITVATQPATTTTFNYSEGVIYGNGSSSSNQPTPTLQCHYHHN